MEKVVNFVRETTDSDYELVQEQMVLLERSFMSDCDSLFAYNEDLVRTFYELVMEHAKIEARKEDCDIANVVASLNLEGFLVEAARRCGVDMVRLCDEVEAEGGRPLRELRGLQAAGWFGRQGDKG